MAERFVAKVIEGACSYEELLERWRQWAAMPGVTLTGPPEELAHAGYEQCLSRIGQYEKDGGGLTADISEAKLIGWRSQKKWRRDRPEYELIPVNIVPIVETP